VTVTEASARLGIEYDFCLRLLRMGKLKGVKKRRQWIVNAQSVKQRLEQVADHRARRAHQGDGNG
jgi:excisionase family DNA binding protein